MTTETKWSINQTQSSIAFRVGQLMMGHVNNAFKTFDSRIISKYIEIANINFAEKKKI